MDKSDQSYEQEIKLVNNIVLQEYEDNQIKKLEVNENGKKL